MKAKVLKSKITPELYGKFQIWDNKDLPKDTEILQCLIPQLYSKDTTIKDLKHILKNTTAINQLKDYDFVDVEIVVRKKHFANNEI